MKEGGKSCLFCLLPLEKKLDAICGLPGDVTFKLWPPNFPKWLALAGIRPPALDSVILPENTHPSLPDWALISVIAGEGDSEGSLDQLLRTTQRAFRAGADGGQSFALPTILEKGPKLYRVRTSDRERCLVWSVALGKTGERDKHRIWISGSSLCRIQGGPLESFRRNVSCFQAGSAPCFGNRRPR